MDVREKMVELLDEAEEWADHKCDELECETCPANKMKGNCVQKLMVDRLIAHGVTVQEWISVNDRLPEQGQEVIVYSGGVLKPTVFAYQFWNKNYDSWARVTHWMPLPRPPKEE